MSLMARILLQRQQTGSLPGIRFRQLRRQNLSPWPNWCRSQLDMNLQDTITEALQLTAELRARVSASQLADCQQLVEARGLAIEAIPTLYEAANKAEVAGCSSLLAELKDADQSLQQVSQNALKLASKDWNRSLGQTSSPRHEYDRVPDLACLDRKA